MECIYCRGEIPPERQRRNAKTCSFRCANDLLKARLRKANPSNGMATATVGSIAELVAAVDLMRRGCNVFRALSSSCPCDLAAVRGGRLITVEVRSAHTRLDGTWTCTGSHRADLLAMVRGNEVRYTRCVGNVTTLIRDGESLDPMKF
jgi:hypothetical protein